MWAQPPPPPPSPHKLKENFKKGAQTPSTTSTRSRVTKFLNVLALYTYEGVNKFKFQIVSQLHDVGSNLPVEQLFSSSSFREVRRIST